MDDKWIKDRQPEYLRTKLLQVIPTVTTTRPRHYLHPGNMAIRRHDATKFGRIQIS
jgi:hypothetical protein